MSTDNQPCGNDVSVTMHEPTFSSVARLALSRSDLNKNEKLLLVAMGTFINATTRICFPGTERLERLTGLSGSTIRRERKGLEKKGILRSRGQRTLSDGSWGSNSYELTGRLDIDGGGQGDQLNPETSSVTNKGIQVVMVTTPLDPEVVASYRGDSWIARLIRELCWELADLLIELDWKDGKYRDDADSDDWIYHMGTFVSGTLPSASAGVGGYDRLLVEEIYREAIFLAPESIDFGPSSSEMPPPRLLIDSADQLIGSAVTSVGPPDAEPAVERPSFEELERRRVEKERLNEEFGVAVTPKVMPNSRIDEQDFAGVRRRQGRPAAVPVSERERIEDAEFVAEIDAMLESLE